MTVLRGRAYSRVSSSFAGVSFATAWHKITETVRDLRGSG